MHQLNIVQNVSVLTKTYVTAVLAVLALFEFITAMYVFGHKKNKSRAKLALTIHRIGGYIFLLYWIWPMTVGADLLGRLSRYSDDWQFDGRKFFHAFIGVTVFLMLILKICFVRFYQKYRTYARLLGILISIASLATWIISGGFWLCMMAGRTVP